MNYPSLDKAHQGDEFWIKQGGKMYIYVGKTKNGLYIYYDEDGNLYDRKYDTVFKLVKT